MVAVAIGDTVSTPHPCAQTDKSGTKGQRAKGPKWGPGGQSRRRAHRIRGEPGKGGSLWKPHPNLQNLEPVFTLTHMQCLSGRGIFSLPLPPLIKNYKCLIKS